MKYMLVLITAYLLGAIPWAYIVTKKVQGIDIRMYGSGNVGFTNVLRTVGKGPAFLVLAGDIGKGMAAVLLAKYFGGPELATMAGLAVVTGHNYPVFLRFKGGKGAAAGIGALIALLPFIAFWAVIVWAIIVAVTRYVSLGTILGALTVPILCLAFQVDISYALFGIIGASFVIFKHRTNVSRLINGTERKIGRKV